MDAARGITVQGMKKIAGRPPGTKMQDECISVFCDSSKSYACKDAAGVGGGLTKIFAHTGRTGKEQYALQEFAQIQANDAVVADDVCPWNTLWPYTILLFPTGLLPMQQEPASSHSFLTQVQSRMHVSIP